MALSRYVEWTVRVNGLQTNGGGFDPTVSGAGTDYSDQDAPQLSLTDLTSTNSTTVTTVLGTFTSAMVGNVLRIASGTGATTGYYTITAYTSATQVTLDRVSGTYTAGVAKVGGATHKINTFSNGGSGTAPTLTSPLLPGHIVWIRSAGSSTNPSIGGTPDYDHTDGYLTFPNGDTTSGPIRWIGLGASESKPAFGVMPTYFPLMKTTGLLFFNSADHKVFHVKGFNGSSPSFTTYGLCANFGNGGSMAFCIYDVNGVAMSVTAANTGVEIFNNEIYNTGGGSTGQTQTCIEAINNGVSVFNNYIENVRGPAITVGGQANYAYQNTINSVGNHGIVMSLIANYIGDVFGNTIYNCAGDGINMTQDSLLTRVYNNTISKIPSGKYAINVTSGTTAVNDRLKTMVDYNNLFLDGGAGALRNNISAGAHDLNLDPQFTNPGAGDFTIGTNLKAVGFGPIPLT